MYWSKPLSSSTASFTLLSFKENQSIIYLFWPSSSRSWHVWFKYSWIRSFFNEVTLKLTGKSFIFNEPTPSWFVNQFIRSRSSPSWTCARGQYGGQQQFLTKRQFWVGRKFSEMASFVTEVLASSGKLEKDDLASKISKLSRKVEETKVNKLGWKLTLLAVLAS